MDKIDKLEKKHQKIQAEIDNKEFKTKVLNDRYQIIINKYKAKMEKATNRQNEFIEKKKLELDKNSKLVIAEAEYAKKLGIKHTEKQNIKKRKEQEHKKEVAIIKKEARSKGILK